MFTTRSSSTTLPPMKRPRMATEMSGLSALSDLSHKEKCIVMLERSGPPDHWKPPKRDGALSRLHRILFSILCLCAYGRTDLDFIWAAIQLAEEGDDSVWVEGRRRTSELQNNILVVAGLLLATSSVFITTPPPRPDLIDYIRWGPYFCICGAFGVLIGVITVCSVMVLVTTNLSPTHARDVLLGSRLHLYLTLIITSYPPVWTAVATLMLALGIQTGVWTASNLGFKLTSGITLIQPLSMGLLYAITSMPVRRGPPERSMTEASSKEKEDDA